MKGGNGLDRLSFFLSMVYRMNEKNMRQEDKESCVLCYGFYTFFSPHVGCVLGEGTSGFSTSDVARLWFGPKYSFLNREASQCPPSGLTVCLQAVELAAAAPSRLHRYVSKETTHRQNDRTRIFFFLFLFFVFTYT